jgi:LAO/AO transport system kinase
MQQINPNLSIKKSDNLSGNALLKALLAGKRAALSRAITLTESNNPKHRKEAEQLLAACEAEAGKSVRIGITGVPGVGKSTFIESFGQYLTGRGKKLAVLAVDPSSQRSGGSILGDKTRMTKLSQNENAYIRPSPASSSLGGVTQMTREAIILCEAAGFDVILVETVGVGQSETAVHNMVDYFMLLMIAGAGDELQGIKRGIMEMADGFVITKSDGDNVKQSKQSKIDIQNAIRFLPPLEHKWRPKVLLSSALSGEGIADIWEDVSSFIKQMKETAYFENRRREQELQSFKDHIRFKLEQQFLESTKSRGVFNEAKAKVAKGELSAFEAARIVLKAME